MVPKHSKVPPHAKPVAKTLGDFTFFLPSTLVANPNKKHPTYRYAFIPESVKTFSGPPKANLPGTGRNT